MMPQYFSNHIRANCPNCEGALSNFHIVGGTGTHLPAIKKDGEHNFNGQKYNSIVYQLVQCAGCGRGGFCKVHINKSGQGIVEEFFPLTTEISKLPESTPPDIVAEFRESETCASISAWRASSAMLRSTLEKVLKKNGYDDGGLERKINKAAEDGIITASRQKKAHEDIRVLGNDIMHDEWKNVTEEDYMSSHHYVQRIIEDFYDDRPSVEKILKDKKRLQANP